MRIRTLFASASFLLLVIGSANAQNPDRSALRGVAATSVVIEPLDADARNVGLTEDQLRADVELRLRKAGVQISDNSTSFLYVNVTDFRSAACGGIYALDVEVKFNRIATIDIGKGVMSIEALTAWSKGLLATEPPRDFVTSARRIVADLCDQFLNDYLAANQKPR